MTVLTPTNAFPGGIAFPQHKSSQTATVVNYLYPGAVQPERPGYIEAFPGIAFPQHKSGQIASHSYVYAGAVQPGVFHFSVVVGNSVYAYTRAAAGVTLIYDARAKTIGVGSGVYVYTVAAAGVTLTYGPIASGDFTVGGESVEDLFETTGVSYTGAPLSRKTSTH